MENQIARLESKVGQVVSLCQSLRTENHDLRSQLAAAEEENRRLQARMEEARNRLNQLAEQLPAEEDDA